LIDLYLGEAGLVLWLLADTGERLSLRLAFPVTFYAAGPDVTLHRSLAFLARTGG